MKKQKLKFNKSKLFARVILLIFSLANMLCFSSCIFQGIIVWHKEVYSHEEFVQWVEGYNSRHDLYVDTFISFDLDDNEQVTKRLYASATRISTKHNGFIAEHGYICDIHGYIFPTNFVFYLKGDGENANDYAYKIRCKRRVVDFNFTENDNIEIRASECTNSSDAFLDYMYEKSLIYQPDSEKVSVYNHIYHYSMYVNDALIACFHISSIDESSEEKLNEIIQMMSDSLVILNTEKYFIWREMK